MLRPDLPIQIEQSFYTQECEKNTKISTVTNSRCNVLATSLNFSKAKIQLCCFTPKPGDTSQILCNCLLSNRECVSVEGTDVNTVCACGCVISSKQSNSVPCTNNEFQQAQLLYTQQKRYPCPVYIRFNAKDNELGLYVGSPVKPNHLILEIHGIFCLSSELESRHKFIQHVFQDSAVDGIVCDCRVFGNSARSVRYSCLPNAEIRSRYVGNRIHFGIFSTTVIHADSEIFIPWPNISRAKSSDFSGDFQDYCPCRSVQCHTTTQLKRFGLGQSRADLLEPELSILDHVSRVIQCMKQSTLLPLSIMDVDTLPQPISSAPMEEEPPAFYNRDKRSHRRSHSRDGRDRERHKGSNNRHNHHHGRNTDPFLDNDDYVPMQIEPAEDPFSLHIPSSSYRPPPQPPPRVHQPPPRAPVVPAAPQYPVHIAPTFPTFPPQVPQWPPQLQQTQPTYANDLFLQLLKAHTTMLEAFQNPNYNHQNQVNPPPQIHTNINNNNNNVSNNNNDNVFNLSLDSQPPQPQPQPRITPPAIKGEVLVPDVPAITPTENIEAAKTTIQQLKSEIVQKTVLENISPALRSLELRKLDGAASLPISLECLSLKLDREPTIQQLQSLGKHTNLKVLHICSRTFTTAVSSSLTTLTSLLELNLEDCININSATLQPFDAFTKLVTLSLRGCYNVDYSVGNILEKLPNLTSIDLSGTKIRNRTLDKIRHSALELLHLKECRELSYDPQNPSDSSFARLLMRAPALTDLNVSGCHKLSEGLSQISVCHGLKELDASNTSLNKMQLVVILQSNTNLEKLNITNCQLTDDDLCDDSVLKLMQNLKLLRANGITFTDSNYGTRMSNTKLIITDKLYSELEHCDLFVETY